MVEELRPLPRVVRTTPTHRLGKSHRNVPQSRQQKTCRRSEQPRLLLQGGHRRAQEQSHGFLLVPTGCRTRAAEAQFNLGECYEFGIGVTKNLNEAIRYYRLAARQGYEEARIALQEHGVW